MAGGDRGVGQTTEWTTGKKRVVAASPGMACSVSSTVLLLRRLPAVLRLPIQRARAKLVSGVVLACIEKRGESEGVVDLRGGGALI